MDREGDDPGGLKVDFFYLGLSGVFNKPIKNIQGCALVFVMRQVQPPLSACNTTI
jgi:hypothetical protein